MPGRWLVFRKGHKEYGIFAIQSLLRGHGHQVQADGDPSLRTENAVRAAQRWGMVDVNAIVGTDTWQQLVSFDAVTVSDSRVSIW